MCGIAGYLNLGGEPASGAVADAMAAAVTHRGPDGSGVFVDREVAFGHRRLAIIDLSPTGDQPMTTGDGRYSITYNGEVYNFRELRSELERLGCQFRSTSDTEVVLQAWARWGEDALERFNGMFAFAIWDAHERELFVARDRYGIKPVYWFQRGSVFAFGSEVKALLQHPSLSPQLDLAALLEYFTFQNLLSERTLFQDARLLPAGTLLRISAASPQPRMRRWWDFAFREPAGQVDDREYLEELDRLFRQAVQRQMVADVPVNSYLSGGLDSGSITAVASAEVELMRTFTVGFDLRSASGIELGFDEREAAEHMSYLFGTEHYEMVLKAGDLERAMPRLAWHIEEPRVGQSYPNFYAAHLASRFGKVVLSGTGGDELFGGYPWRYYRAVVNADFDEYVDKYYAYWQRLLPNSVLRKAFAPVWDEVKDVWTRDIFRDVFAHHSERLEIPEDYVNHSLYFEAKTFLHGLLVVEDKLSMASSLETRVPFLDNDLVDFSQRVPVHLKLRSLREIIRLNENEPGSKTERFFDSAHDGKVLLREAMKRYVPDKVPGARKQGFSAPDASWFRGESIDYVRERLLDSKSAIYDVLDYGVMRELLEEHLGGTQNRRLLIWSLLSFDEWQRTFISGDRQLAESHSPRAPGADGGSPRSVPQTTTT